MVTAPVRQDSLILGMMAVSFLASNFKNTRLRLR